MPVDQLFECVELYLGCRDLPNLDLLSKSDPFVVVYLKTEFENDGKWYEFARTETIQDNLNPDFSTQIKIDYHFEEIQHICFRVYDRDSKSSNLDSHDFIGEYKTTLAAIVSDPAYLFSATLLQQASDERDIQRGKLFVHCETIHGGNDYVTMKCSAKNLDRKNWFGLGSSDPFFRISRCTETGNFIKVFESEVHKSNLNPNFNEVNMSLQKLANNDLDRPIKIEIFDWEKSGDHKFIGGYDTSCNELLSQDCKEYVLKGKKSNKTGIFVLESIRINKRHSFVEYIRGGCELQLTVAIDFTASNGNPSDLRSLHYISNSPNTYNQYQQAIRSVGQILQEYDSDKKFPVYGFGGRVNGQVSHCFPLSLDPRTHEVDGVDGILAAYHHAVQTCTLSGPTLFSKVIAQAAGIANRGFSQSNQHYSVLLILTDGVISDMENTIDQIVAASDMPLSIIIVGVGNADFQAMDVLDADDTPLVSRQGIQMKRDIVQFVPFNQFSGHINAARLAKHTLAEIPTQMESYFESKGVVPNALAKPVSLDGYMPMHDPKAAPDVIPVATPL